ncbi:uncharacterized protein C17orf113-like [Babylonia areolata]|uniref:uncharacterized protein C17orf113-like n=1 Tax=Babylonia areolata TaxID=304850 RepID=UPI003FD19BB8
MVPHSEAARADEKECVKAHFRTLLCMSKRNIAANNFGALIELQEVNGVQSLKSGPVYTHHSSVSQMEQCLDDITKQEIREKLEKSDSVGIIIDETLNCTLDKKLIMFARIENNGVVETLFLGNYTIDRETSECVFDMLVEVLQEWSITDRQLAGLGSDGASVMTGRLNGVGVRLKARQPALVHIHCAAHRVALATKDATENVQSISDYRLCLQQIFKLYKASGDRTHRLKEICDALDSVEYLCLKHPISVRWLSLGKAVTAVRSVYPALTLELEEEAQRKNAAAVGLSRKCRMFAFVAMTYMLSDIIPVMERLNLTFQQEEVNLSDIHPAVQSAKARLQHLLTTPGQKEQEFSDVVTRDDGVFQTIRLTHVDREATFKAARQNFIEQLLQSLRDRFPDDQMSIVSALANIFDRQRYPPSNPIPGPLDHYATRELTVLTRHYATVLNGPRAQTDFNQFKRTLSGYGGDDTFAMSCRIVIRNMAVQYPDFASLAKIALVIPVSSVAAERGFSVQNGIKTEARSRLGEGRVSRLMRLNIHAKSVRDFDVDCGTDRFLAMKVRRK